MEWFVGYLDPEMEQIIVAQKHLEMKGLFWHYCNLFHTNHNHVLYHCCNKLQSNQGLFAAAEREESLLAAGAKVALTAILLVIKKHKEDKHGSQTSSSNFINVKMFFSTEQKCAYYILVVS